MEAGIYIWFDRVKPVFVDVSRAQARIRNGGGVIKVATQEELVQRLRRLDIGEREATVEDINFRIRRFRRHVHSDCTVGGFVEETARASRRAHVGKSSLVLDRAFIFGFGRLEGYAIAAGDSKVSDWARLRDMAYIGDFAEAFGNTDISGTARLCQNAKAGGHSKIFGNALLFGNVQVKDHAVVAWYSQLCGNLRVGSLSWP
jgi:hypothetical protein